GSIGSIPFILVMKSLHLSVSRAVEAGIFSGIKVDPSLTVSHLFYTDDAVFIGEWSDGYLRSTMHMLFCFPLSSGLKINLKKTQLLGVGVASDLLTEAAVNIGCSVMKTTFKYLGVMVRDRRGVQVPSILCSVCNVAHEDTSHLFFSCVVATARLICRWWNLTWIPIGSYSEEIDKIEKYIGGLPDMILGGVKASRSKTMEEVIEFTTELMEDKTKAYAERQADNKRKSEDIARNNQNHQPYKRQNTGQGNSCFECGAQGHFKRNCPKLKNNDRGNQARNDRAPTRVCAVGNAGANPDNVVAGTFLLSDHCASILFDTGADKSFMSAAFSSLINMNPSTLDYTYDVELANGQIVGVNTIIRGCTLNLLNLSFNIDLMPIELGSFDVIVGMDWLKTYHAVIVCDEKIVHDPFEDETFII
nr:putative reverse transcriptase domain-containing protein [Tanacetum cinerariifolium]